MGSDTRMFVRVVNERTLDALTASGFGYALYKSGRWVEIQNRFDPAALSKALETEVAELYLSTTMDSIEIFISAFGRRVRQLSYGTGDRRGWKKPVGKPRAYEHPEAVKAWLKKKGLLASPDGYDVMDAVLGEAGDARRIRWSAFQPLDSKALSKALGVKVPRCSGFVSTDDDDGAAWLIELAPDYRGGVVAEGNLPRWLLDHGVRLVDATDAQPKPWVDGRRLVSMPNFVRASEVRRVQGLQNKKTVAFEVAAPYIVRAEKEPERFWWLFVAEV